MKYTAHITKIKTDKEDPDNTIITLETTNKKCRELKPGHCVDLEVLPNVMHINNMETEYVKLKNDIGLWAETILGFKLHKKQIELLKKKYDLNEKIQGGTYNHVFFDETQDMDPDPEIEKDLNKRIKKINIDKEDLARENE